MVAIICLLFISTLRAQDTLIIQEKALGLCTYDGVIVTSSSSITGWTGPGFIDAANGKGVTISWEIYVPFNDEYWFSWRYAFGGTATNYRDGKLVIDGNPVIDTVYFPYTGSWSNWRLIEPVKVNLSSGNHKIRLEALWPAGLANIDYFMVIGKGPQAAECSPQYVISVKANNPAWGKVWYEPVYNYYDIGTRVTLHAQPFSGYFFESWTGEEPSNDSVFTFIVRRNVNAVARFLPIGAKQDSDLIGYATVQDDKGTTFLLTGGSIGDTLRATTLAELQSYLGDTIPRVVKFSGLIAGNERIKINSNKTLLGEGNAHLKGIALEINQARNVIIRNLTISEVVDSGKTNDAIEINGGSKNIWIDHCDLYSDRLHDKDYYDGLLDIKNGSTFITVSWCRFHDHYKVCLLSSGDDQFIDTVARITFHHNFFYNCGSRVPMIRFGRGHIFNNYYKNCDDGIDSRMGAWLIIENNYFENVNPAVLDRGSTIPGRAKLVNNYFRNSYYQNLPECDFVIPYKYTLDSVDAVPQIVSNSSGVRTAIKFGSSSNFPQRFSLRQNYPNPFNNSTKIEYALASPSRVKLTIYNLNGQVIVQLVDQVQTPGIYTVEWNPERIESGIYFYKLEAGSFQEVKKCVILK